MEASEPAKLRDKIVTATTKYLAQSDQWSTVAIIRNNAGEFMCILRKILGIKQEDQKKTTVSPSPKPKSQNKDSALSRNHKRGATFHPGD